jgi:hypothetical protein
MPSKSTNLAAGDGEARQEFSSDNKPANTEIANTTQGTSSRSVLAEHAAAIRALGSTRVEPIPLAHIKDGGAQIRVEMRAETVNDYANDMLDGAVFPPVIVFDDGHDLWLAEGYHRVEANRKIGRETIVAEIKKGSARDAVLYGIGANAEHGLRRTQADKRRAVERLLRDPEWARWSDRKLAEIAKVDHKTIGAIRKERSGEFPTTAKKPNGEFPTGYGKPNNRASLLGDVLRTIPDDVLVAECRRRGLTVGAADV